ncbi:alpha/beta fold hydrolase [Paenibacillus ferrarius]|uniref:alpha/beta fold hydrolase n=1 Tax=Paenibacillus ferrarius TaxID=1469647 RepID=UPI003D29B96D
MANIFLTGGTGFIGTHLLQQLEQEGHVVTVLVRSMAKWQSLRDALGLQRSVPVVGDLSLPGLGLREFDRSQALSSEVVIHAGGPMDIRLSETEARTVFLEAADELLKLAEAIHKGAGLRHFIHVVGFKSPFTEENFRQPAAIIQQLATSPPYEQMKFLADLRIREGASALGFPLSVVHPSVVIGSSATGDTPQTGGLGILVGATGRGLMRIVPGAATHWLPLVHVDHAASMICALAGESAPVSQTYYLLDPAVESPPMGELVGGIAHELRVNKPIGTIKPKLLTKLLSTPLGRKLGVPAESMDFIVERATPYPLSPTQRVQREHGLPASVQSDMLPHTIADLDYRLQHGNPATPQGYARGKRGPLATLERGVSGGQRGIGTAQTAWVERTPRQATEEIRGGREAAAPAQPAISVCETAMLPNDGAGSGHSAAAPTLVFVHGTFSSADCLLPLAEQFPEADVCLVDLPGFGRSPYHHAPDVMAGHVESLVQAILAFPAPVTLVGHSLGGLVAALAAARVPGRVHRLHLLQPAFTTARTYRSARLTAAALRFLRAAGLRRQLAAQSCFADIRDIPEGYVAYVLQELRSSRVRRTTADTLAALAKRAAAPAPQLLSTLREKAMILWGTQDHYHTLAAELRAAIPTATIAAAHHFPISHPGETARLLREYGLFS